MDDSALRLFLEDAQRQGLSVREYEAKYGILLMPAQTRIAQHEISFSAMSHGQARQVEKTPADDDGGLELREAA